MKSEIHKLKARVLKTILSNLVPPQNRRIGVEIETLFYDSLFRRIPVNKGKSFSAEDLMNSLLGFQVLSAFPCTYSLEPGGQLEWASSPFVSLHEINLQFQSHCSLLKKICLDNNLIPIDFSIDPIYSPSDVNLIDMKKYALMENRFFSTGRLGSWMMKNSTSVQINIDLVNKNDGEEMAYVADCIQPIFSLLFAHSPFASGLPVNNNYRLKVWNNTDKQRCGHLIEHGINKKEGLLNQYIDYVFDVPSIFIETRESTIVNYKDTLGRWLLEKHLSKELLNKNVLSALHQIFTHVRFKNVIEIRGGDRPPFGYELAPVAFWCGLLTAEKTRKHILDLVLEWTQEERVALNLAAESLNLTQIGPQGKTLGRWLKIVSDVAIQGLEERMIFFKIESEKKYLEPYLEKALEKLWTVRTQDSFKKSGLNINTYLKEVYS